MKTSQIASLPPIYTHPIGSLPRPKVVRDLIERRDQISADRFQSTMDDLVVFAMQLQEQAGLDVVTDGEWRRTQYIREFLTRIGGFERCRRFTHQGETKVTDVVVKRISTSEPVFTRDARFLAENTDRCTKFALPSPFLIAVRYWHEDYSLGAYPTIQHFIDHLTQIIAAKLHRWLKRESTLFRLMTRQLLTFATED